jgi:hypothetical protein
MPSCSAWFNELDELAEGAVLGMDAVKIGDIVAIVAVRRWIERLQPHAGDAQAGKIIQPLRKSGEIADAVAT